MKKKFLFSALLFSALFLSCNISQAAPPPPPGGAHHRNVIHDHHRGAIHRPPMGVIHRHRPAPPPARFGYPYYGSHLRRNVIYTNYWWNAPYIGGMVGYYPCNHINIGFRF